MRERRIGVVVCAVIIGMASLAAADEVVFKNGDRLSGKIVKLDGGKLTISTAMAGEVNVNMTDVKTFATDGPIDVHLKDGTVVRQKIVAGEDGRFAIEKGGALQAQSFPIADVASINPPAVKWTGSLSAGVLVTRGNSYSDNFNINFDAVRRAADDRITVGGGYAYGREKDTNTGDKNVNRENWFALGKYDYFFTPKFYGYGNARVEKDRIADLDLRFTPGVGVGYQWVESAKTNFSTEGGVSWVYEQFTSPDETRQHVAARLAYHLDHKLNDRVQFFHDLEFLPSVENLSEYLVNAQAGLRASLTEAMFTEFKIVYKYNSDPSTTADKTDLQYIANVGWRF